MEEEVKHLIASPIEEGAHFEVLTLGIPRDPADFIKDAHEIGHPRGLRSSSCIDEGSPGGSLPW